MNTDTATNDAIAGVGGNVNAAPSRDARASLLAFRDAVLLHSAFFGLFVVFNIFRFASSRFRGALKGFTGTYRFRSGNTSRIVVFNGNSIKTRRGVPGDSHNFEIAFTDLPGALSYMAKYPNDPITLIMENKIVQSGNLFYLYKFGYLAGLCESIATGLFRRKKKD